MPVSQYLRRFLRKFVFDVLPAALASLIGAMFFAQHWSQPAPALRTGAADRLAVQSEEVTRMVREEHALMVEFLVREQERNEARQPLTIREMKAREAALAAPRRPAAEPLREAKSAAPAPSRAPAVPEARSASTSPSAPATAPVKPDGDMVAIESGPLAAPDAKPAGGFARVAAWAHEWADKAVDVTGLRYVPALVRTIKGEAETVGSEFQTMSDAHLVAAPR